MENGDKLRKHWKLAVAASLFLHAVVLGVLSIWPVPSAMPLQSAGTPQIVPLILTELEEGGEVSFVGRTPSPGVRYSEPRGPENLTTSFDSADLRDPLGYVVVPVAGLSPGQGTSESDGQAGTALFQPVARGQRVVYVIDSSSSMGKNGALKVATAELLASLAKLPPDALFQIIIYNTTARELVPSLPGWLAPTQTILDRMQAALSSLAAEGRTEHAPALRLAFHLRPDVVFLLTDADDLTPEHIQQVRVLNRSRAVMHTVELTTKHRGRAGMPLQVLAREHGGTYQCVGLAD